MIKIRELSLDERLALYEKANTLHEQGLGRTRVAKLLGISDNTTSHWFHEGMKPGTICRYSVEWFAQQKPHSVNLEPSPTLFYITGVVLGDGCINADDYGPSTAFRIILGATEEKFAISFYNALKSIGLNPCFFSRVPKDPRRKKVYTAKGISKLLYHYLKNIDYTSIRDKMKKNPNLAIAFTRGFYESEGALEKCKYGRDLKMSNTKQALAKLVKGVLVDLGFHPTGWRIKTREEYVLRLPRREIDTFLQQINPAIKI